MEPPPKRVSKMRPGLEQMVEVLGIRLAQITLSLRSLIVYDVESLVSYYIFVPSKR